MRFIENLTVMIGYGIIACLVLYVVVILPSPAGQREYNKATSELKQSYYETINDFYHEMGLD